MNKAKNYIKVIFAFGMTALLGNVATADNYRVQVDLQGMRSDADMRTKKDLDVVQATYYLKRVETVDSIIAESAFLNKSSSIAVNYVDGQLEQPASKVDGDGWGVAAKYVANERMIYEASYSTEDIMGVDNPTWGIGLGWYIDDLTTFGVSIRQNDPDNNVHSTFKSYELNLKGVIDVNEGNRAVGEATAGVMQLPGANTVIQIGGSFDYYLSPRFSVGGQIGLILPNNGNDENLYGLQASYFFGNSIALEAAFTTAIFQEEENTPDVDATDTFTIKLTGRI